MTVDVNDRARLIRGAIGTVLVYGILLFSSCANVDPPLQRDRAYPADWPEISQLGHACGGLDGAYDSVGTMVGAEGRRTMVTMEELFPGLVNREAKSVSLQIITKKVEANGDAIGTLLVTATDGTAVRQIGFDCYCVKGALMFVAASGGGAIPGALAGSQRNVWLNKAADGSLLARINDIKVGLIMVVPYGSSSSRWCRFLRWENGRIK